MKEPKLRPKRRKLLRPIDGVETKVTENSETKVLKCAHLILLNGAEPLTAWTIEVITIALTYGGQFCDVLRSPFLAWHSHRFIE